VRYNPFSMKLTLACVSAASLCLLAALGHAQPWEEHAIGPPPVPGASPLEQDADNFMAAKGYRVSPGITKYGSVTSRSPATLSISLRPGKWAIAILNWNNSTCTLSADYRDAGYAPGKESYRFTQGPGFQFAPFNVESNLGGILLSVYEATRQPGPPQRCGYEIRFYNFENG
jgi:hypothetical protein